MNVHYIYKQRRVLRGEHEAFEARIDMRYGHYQHARLTVRRRRKQLLHTLDDDSFRNATANRSTWWEGVRVPSGSDVRTSINRAIFEHMAEGALCWRAPRANLTSNLPTNPTPA